MEYAKYGGRYEGSQVPQGPMSLVSLSVQLGWLPRRRAIPPHPISFHDQRRHDMHRHFFYLFTFYILYQVIPIHNMHLWLSQSPHCNDDHIPSYSILHCLHLKLIYYSVLNHLSSLPRPWMSHHITVTTHDLVTPFHRLAFANTRNPLFSFQRFRYYRCQCRID